jgi:EAL domain-containing protein (putative c-di-GMP-specific phosphodiesterase class I)
VDTLKVDRTFVDGIGVDSEDSAIVRSIVALASTLGMTTIGEGVENAQQLSTLTTLGCTKAQGFHLARPATAPVIEEFLLRPPTTGQVPPPRSELTPVRAS